MPFPAKTSTEAIIKSAGDIVHTQGLAALSMRTLAARLGVRASSLYRHFPDRSAIENTLAARAGEQLLDRMQQSMEGQMGERALCSAAWAYWEYTSSNKSFYDVLMLSRAPEQPKSKAAQEIWDFWVRLVSDTTRREEDLAGAATLWAFLHGFSVLQAAGLPSDLPARLVFTRGLQSLIRALSSAEAEAASAS